MLYLIEICRFYGCIVFQMEHKNVDGHFGRDCYCKHSGPFEKLIYICTPVGYIHRHEIPGLYGIKQFPKVVPEIYTPNQQCTTLPVVIPRLKFSVIFF